MEFGKLSDVENVSWDLPPHDPLTQKYLHGFLEPTGVPNKTKFYIGAPAWGRKEWVGRVYPPHTAAARFLFHYSRNFNCIELNSTHYGIPSHDTVKKWVDMVPADFLFCPKVPQLISHHPGGLMDARTIGTWLSCLKGFGDNLGPCFLQLPPHFSYADKKELFQFLKLWPLDVELCMELRHASWFADVHVLPPLVEYLQTRGIGLVITDVAGRRDLSHSSISAPFGFLRFIGNDLHPSDYTRARIWSKRLSEWQGWGLKRFFYMVHEPDDIRTPDMTDFVIQELNANCDAELTPLAAPLV